MTSSLTRRSGPPHVRPVTPSRSRPAEPPCSGFVAENFRCDSDVQGPKRVEQFDFIHMTTNSSNPARPGERATSQRTIDAGGRWSNARLHGLWPTAIDGSDFVAWRGTSSVSRCALPPPIFGGWSTWAWSTTGTGGSGQREMTRKPGSSRRDRSRAVPTWVADFNPFHVGASVGHIPGLRRSNYAQVGLCSTGS
jgi:hypothetical protein